jgi:hypothetical protein
MAWGGCLKVSSSIFPAALMALNFAIYASRDA